MVTAAGAGSRGGLELVGVVGRPSLGVRGDLVVFFNQDVVRGGPKVGELPRHPPGCKDGPASVSRPRRGLGPPPDYGDEDPTVNGSENRPTAGEFADAVQRPSSSDDRIRQLNDLHSRILRLSNRVFPTHVATRLTYILSGEEIVFLDVHPEQGGLVSGRVVAFSARHLAVVDVTDGHPDEATSGSVRLVLVPRSALIRLETAEEGGPQVWDEYRPSWPSRGAVKLTYTGLSEPVTVPRAPTSMREDFGAFLPSLLRDMHG